MGLVDILAGTVASGYIFFRLGNKALEKVFFTQDPQRKRLLQKSAKPGRGKV